MRLSAPQRRTLEHLAANGRPPTTSRVAYVLGVDAMVAGKTLAALTRRALVTPESGGLSRGKPVTRWAITTKGRRQVA